MPRCSATDLKVPPTPGFFFFLSSNSSSVYLLPVPPLPFLILNVAVADRAPSAHVSSFHVT